MDPKSVPAVAGTASSPSGSLEPSLLIQRLRTVRALSLRLIEDLTPEDAMVQSMPDASPSKWHLAHTTWFYERFVLAASPGYAPIDTSWDYLFNSYYNGVGPRLARSKRGLMSRPTLEQVIDYRRRVDDRLERRIRAGDLTTGQLQVLLLGTHHEQQHQELLLTDIKHAFWSNPAGHAYRDRPGSRSADTRPDPGALHWHAQDEGLVDIGAGAWPGAMEFAFDNETPRHRVFVASHALSDRLVTNAEYSRFVAAGGYKDASLWLSDGWALVESEGWTRPLYWHEDGEREFTLDGWQVRSTNAPVCHLSFFEADAFARWVGARLPTEAEWERAAANASFTGNFLESGALHPKSAPAGDGIRQLYGDAWEWTASAYTPYPGFVPLEGSLGEYNGKFMNGQWVLRGGSCVTPANHMRTSYRNFFPPAARWQFSGVRLAKDLP